MATNTLTIRILLFSVACIFVTLASFLQVLPVTTSGYISNTQGLSSEQIASLSALLFVSYAILQIPCGILLDKYGVRWLLPISIFITIIGCVLYWLNIDTLSLGGSRLILGIGCAISYIAAIYIAIQFFPLRYLALLIGLLEAVSTIGDLLATRAYGMYLIFHGWNIAHLTVILVTVILFIISLFISQNKKLFGNLQTSFSNKSIKVIFIELKVILSNKAFLSIAAYSFFTWLYLMAFAGYWGRSYFMNMHNFTELESLKLLEYFWIGFLVSSIVVGPLSSKLEIKRPIIVTLAFLGLATLLIMAIPVLFNYTGLVIVALLTGISASGMVIAFAMISEVIPKKIQGTAMGANNTAMIAGAAFGQVLFGYFLVNYNIGNHIEIQINPEYYTALLILPASAMLAFVFIAIGTRKMS